jgi:hypothetical protein
MQVLLYKRLTQRCRNNAAGRTTEIRRMETYPTGGAYQPAVAAEPG